MSLPDHVADLVGVLDALDHAIGTTDDLGTLALTLSLLDRSGADHAPGAKQTLGLVVDNLKARLHGLIPFGETVAIPGVGVLKGSTSGGSTKWSDGAQIARLIALRAVDRSTLDPETGEIGDPPPPAVLGEQVAAELVACGGLDNASASWRVTELEERGIDVSEYRSKSDKRPSVRWMD